MRRFGIGLVIVILLLAALACGRSRPTPEGIPAETKVPSEFPPLERGEDAYRFTIDNQSPYEICYVYISPSDAEYWGDNQLVRNETLAPGESRDFEASSAPQDVLVQDCLETTLDSAWEVTGPFRLVIGDAGTVSLRVINDSYEDICYMLISPSAADRWGEDWLGMQEILSMSHERVFFVPPDTYDLMALTCDDIEIESVYEVNVSREYEWIVVGNGDGGGLWDFDPVGDSFAVTVQNRTPNPICYVYISPSEARTWGEDWLAEDELLFSGDSRVFEVPGGEHDILLEDCDEFVVDTAWMIAEDFILSPGGEGDVALQVLNESREDICYFYISPSTASQWGEDRLGDLEIISSEIGLRVFYIAPGIYDIMAQDCDALELSSEYEVNLQEGRSWTLYD